jgi:hypothetical protein
MEVNLHELTMVIHSIKIESQLHPQVPFQNFQLSDSSP